MIRQRVPGHLARGDTAALPRPGSVAAVLRLFGRSSALRPDPTYGDPKASWLTSAVAARDWPAVRDFLAGQRNHRDVTFYVDVIANISDTQEWLYEVARSDRSSLALTMYGGRLVRYAWELRTIGYASQVSKRQFALFRKWLAEAQQQLVGVVNGDPGNVTAWWYLVDCSRGLGLGIDETMRRFSEVVARCPEHLPAHQSALQQLCAKWGGSHTAMYDFAYQAMRRGRPGSELGLLVVAAHLEYWGSTGLGDGHFARPETVAQLHEAAEVSIRHPHYRPRVDWTQRHNGFAMAFALAGEIAAAAPLFTTLGDRLTEWPWYILDWDNPGKVYQRYRSKVLDAWQAGEVR